MKRLSNLNEVLAFQLEGLYDAEKKLQHAIPACSEGVTLNVLKDIINKYGEQAAEKRTKLKRTFGYLLVEPFKRKNKVIDTMLKDTHYMLEHAASDSLRQVVLLACFQSINHYKMAGYNAALAFAIKLNLDTVSDLLHEILEWEKETNAILTKIAFEELHQKEASSTS
ncbi:DUF892 family protein [Chryseolinea sp. H1M3-3]|uniref:YciE/YciF ferroxidase family protein n=1 Tax=Chryseolinea sp. H1M3-3 TaxID=3034144 RepID=UPI0023EDA5AF|nr:DUF892 family protein [Chryseolinea sp. H1M3-3]